MKNLLQFIILLLMVVGTILVVYGLGALTIDDTKIILGLELFIVGCLALIAASVILKRHKAL